MPFTSRRLGIVGISLVGLSTIVPGGPSVLTAQSTETGEVREPIVIGERVSIRSGVLNEDRPLWIYTPPGYEQSSDRFPVLYLLDAGDHFHHTTGVAQFLSANNRMPAMIVVGIPNVAGSRTRDLTPPLSVPDTVGLMADAGGASAFLDFLTDEAKPWVESHYRIQPFSLLIGHSFGGLFITQVLIEEPGAFDAYVSISPSLWWDERKYVGTAGSIFEDRPDLSGALYMTMGSEGGEMLAGGWTLAGILETSAPESFRWNWAHMPEEDHGSIPHRSTYDALEWTFEGWNMPDAFEAALEEGEEGWSRIEAHYSMLSERFGFEVKVPEAFVNGVGYNLLQMRRVDDAIRAFELNVELYPGSANVYDSLGDGLDAACRWEDARESYARASRMAAKGSLPNEATYAANLERMTARIEAGDECTVPEPVSPPDE
jgi:predicted alpha/beta superfamily hydrolase